MTNDTQIRDSVGDVINPSTLTEQQALKKGTWDSLYNTATIAANTATILNQKNGPVWIISAATLIYHASKTTIPANVAPRVNVSGNPVQPHKDTTFGTLKDYWGLDNGFGRVKITQYDTTNHRFAIHYNFASNPIWVPSADTFWVMITNAHATDTFTGESVLEIGE